MKIAVIDNYDSFVYNLVHYLEDLGVEVEVFRNDRVVVENLKDFDRILLSPGPGLPKDAGKMPEIIDKYYLEKPILGVCLGHQAIAEYFGGQLINLDKVYHGVAVEAEQTEDHCIFEGLNDVFMVGRYHSWVVDKALPPCLKLLARDKENQVMAFKHVELPVFGFQFHPESVLTPDGKKMLENWLINT